MQNIAVQTKASGVQSSTSETSSPIKRKKDQSELIDPFMQIIMSMLAQSQNPNSQQPVNEQGTVNSASEIDALGTENAAGVGSALSSDQIGELVALLQSSQIGLTSVLNLTSSSNSNAEEIANALATLMANATSNQSAVNSVESQADVNLSSQISSMLNNNAKATETVSIKPEALNQLANLLGLSSKEELQSALKSAGITVETGSPVSAQAQFSEAVIKAKEMLSENLSQQSESSDEIDVDKLQNELARSSSKTAFELSLKSTSGTNETPVLDQLKDGIKQNISVGKSEFTIKLNPESLGEITVKLIEEAGKTTLSITTASAATAKLINNDINALKDAVASMSVEVKHAVVQTSESANSSMQQFNMSGQQFAGQQFSGQQSFYQMTQPMTANVENLNSEEVLTTLQGAYVQTVSSDRLDAYI